MRALDCKGSSSLRYGLVSAWALDETGAADRVDLLGRYNLSASGSPGTADGPGDGRGKAVTLAAASNQTLYIASGDASSGLTPGTGDFTFACFVNFSSVGNRMIAGRYHAAGTGREWRLRTDGGNLFSFSLSVDGANATEIVTTGTSGVVGVWQAVRCWKSGAAMRLQKNTGTIASGNAVNASGWTQGTAPWVIGSYSAAGTGLFDGKIAMPHYWNRVLTDGEWLQFYRAGIGRLYPFR